MINSIIAYDIAELEKYKVLTEAKNLYNSELLNEEQYSNIKTEFSTKLYTPSIFIKILLFIVALVGGSTLMGPIALLFAGFDEMGYRIIFLIVGILLIFLTDKVLIKEKKHFKSGVTEAGLYTGLIFLAIGILWIQNNHIITIAIVGFLLSIMAAIRYLNYLSLLAAIGFSIWIIFQIITNLGIEAFMPFIFMAYAAFIFWLTSKLQSKFDLFIFEDHYIIAKSIALILFFIAGNYFVVRELSIELMGLNISEGEDIPFAWIFYFLTAIIPLAYAYWGIKTKSMLFIRVGLLVFALSIITFKYYFSLGFPMVTVTVSGALMIMIALLLFNYLKEAKKGITSKKILQDKWTSKDLTAFIASQTLGGNEINVAENEELFQGGQFGGGGASGNW